jgi:hypothetical protein
VSLGAKTEVERNVVQYSGSSRFGKVQLVVNELEVGHIEVWCVWRIYDSSVECNAVTEGRRTNSSRSNVL